MASNTPIPIATVNIADVPPGKLDVDPRYQQDGFEVPNAAKGDRGWADLPPRVPTNAFGTLRKGK